MAKNSRNDIYIGVYIPKEMKDEVQAVVKANKTKGLPENTLSIVVRLAIRDYLDKVAKMNYLTNSIYHSHLKIKY